MSGTNTTSSDDASLPRPSRQSVARKSTLKTGRTLSAKRERLETSSERIATRQKLRRKERARVFTTIASFSAVAVVIICLGVFLRSSSSSKQTPDADQVTVIYKPTIEVVDENTGGSITDRMSQYIGQAEVDLREYGFIPTKAVIPAGAIREVDLYLDGHSGFIKMTLDRDTAVSAEDALRMINYLEAELGVTDYQYIDVRLPGQAYWK